MKNHFSVEILMKKILFIALLLSSMTTFAFECPKTGHEAKQLKDYHLLMLEEDFHTIKRLQSSITPENHDEVMEEVNYIIETLVMPRQLFLNQLSQCRYDGSRRNPDRREQCDEMADELKKLKTLSLAIKDRLGEIRRSLPEGQNPYENDEYRELAEKKQIYDARIAEISMQC